MFIDLGINPRYFSVRRCGKVLSGQKLIIARTFERSGCCVARDLETFHPSGVKAKTLNWIHFSPAGFAAAAGFAAGVSANA